MESSEIDLVEAHAPRQNRKTLFFLLNRNGLDADNLRKVLNRMFEFKFAAPSVNIAWLSIFGSQPERAHAVLTLSNETITEEILDENKIVYDDSETGVSYTFELSESFGLEAKDNEDPNAFFVTGIPTNIDIEKLKKGLMDHFGQIGIPDHITVPQNWKTNGNVILKYNDITQAQLIARAAMWSTFKDKTIKCCYAKKR